MPDTVAPLLAEDVPLAPLTTLGVGGPARYLARCRDVADLGAALALARERGLMTFVLGGGSNLLVADRGFDGLVVTIEDRTLAFEDEDGTVLVRAGAGLVWDELVVAAVERGLGGVECLSGIPGRVGAAPIQNIGAYGQEVAEAIDAVHAVEARTGEERRFSAGECGFGYRWSRFKGEDRGRWAVVRVDLRLPRRETGAVRYRDLAQRFDGREPSLLEVRREVLEIRRSKSMVLEEDDPNRRSAGSFFLNPFVGEAEVEKVRRRLGAGEEMPAWPAGGGRRKLSAAWLIERSGFGRGFSLPGGRAAVSSRHTLALVTREGARATDVVDLAVEIRRGVRAACGVTLTPEPVFVGFEDDVETLLA